MVDLSTQLPLIRTELQQALADFLKRVGNRYQAVGPMQQELWQHFERQLGAGKMIRGSLAVLVTDVLQANHQQGVQLGLVWELFNSGMLIHDDIIDQDRVRRGQPSMFSVYEAQAEVAHWPQPTHYGISQAICAADLCFFLANLALSEIKFEAKVLPEILHQFAHEAILTGFGEMKDTAENYHQRQLSLAEIYDVLVQKTARYTFVLPMLTAAQAAGVDSAVLDQLEKLGEALGTFFQIKDDELGLFGTTDQLGKPAGSDIREGKQTLYYYYLKQLCSPAEWAECQNWFGHALTAEGLARVQALVVSSGAKAEVDQVMTQLDQTAAALIASLPWSDGQKSVLHQLRQYQVARQR